MPVIVPPAPRREIGRRDRVDQERVVGQVPLASQGGQLEAQDLERREIDRDARRRHLTGGRVDLDRCGAAHAHRRNARHDRVEVHSVGSRLEAVPAIGADGPDNHQRATIGVEIRAQRQVVRGPLEHDVTVAPARERALGGEPHRLERLHLERIHVRAHPHARRRVFTVGGWASDSHASVRPRALAVRDQVRVEALLPVRREPHRGAIEVRVTSVRCGHAAVRIEHLDQHVLFDVDATDDVELLHDEPRKARRVAHHRRLLEVQAIDRDVHRVARAIARRGRLERTHDRHLEAHRVERAALVHRVEVHIGSLGEATRDADGAVVIEEAAQIEPHRELGNRDDHAPLVVVEDDVREARAAEVELVDPADVEIAAERSAGELFDRHAGERSRLGPRAMVRDGDREGGEQHEDRERGPRHGHERLSPPRWLRARRDHRGRRRQLRASVTVLRVARLVHQNASPSVMCTAPGNQPNTVATGRHAVS